MSNVDVSVVFPTRKRPESLRIAIDSLLERATAPDRVEICIAFDPDDVETYQAITTDGGFPPDFRFWRAPVRYGYNQLNLYVNELAKLAVGDWLVWFNDDMRMRTVGWDEEIRQHPRKAVLWPGANHVAHANIAPIWPRCWSVATGRVSPTMHLDTYLQRLGERLGRHDKVGIAIYHNRPDVSGSPEDDTYVEGRKLLGSEGMVPGFDAAAMMREVDNDVELIRRVGLL